MKIAFDAIIEICKLHPYIGFHIDVVSNYYNEKID